MERNLSAMRTPEVSEQDGGDSFLKRGVDVAVYLATIPSPPLLIIIGVVGNLLSFILMNQKKYEKSTTCFYMRCVAVSDSLYIYGRMILRYLLVMAPHLFASMAVKEPFCLYYFVNLAMGTVLSPLLIMAMGFDRFFALTWPLKAASFCTMRRARITAFTVLIFGAIFGLIQVKSKWHEKYQFWLCPYVFVSPWDEVYVTVKGIISAFVPMVTLTFFNVGILVAIYRSKRKALQRSATSTNESSITLATVMTTSAFIAFQIPTKVNDFFWTNWHSEVTKDVQQLQRLTLNLAIATENMNYCLNSYIYVLGCKRLRREMFAICFCKRK
jgi:hypothetical protein